MNLDHAMEYVDFVVERHAIWERRQAGELAPWTTDPVLAARKFTNVFRILDYDSQWLLANLLDGEPRDVLMRCFLFRHTGRVEAWERLLAELGGPPTVGDLDAALEVWREYRGGGHVRTRTADPRNAGRKTQTDFRRPVFTNAYLVFPQSTVPGTDKLDSIIDLTRRLFAASTTMPDFLAARTQAERFACLRRNKGVADFMSYQVLTDWGYTTEDREDEFVVAGPGAAKGAKLVDPGRRPEDTIRAFRRMLPAEVQLYGRRPSLADLQNTACEFFKYNRASGQPGSKPYAARHAAVSPQLPPNWVFATSPI